MLYLFNDRPRTLLAVFYSLLMVALLLTGCEANNQQFLATGTVTNIILNPMSGDSSGWQTLEDEVGSSDKDPILSGLPGAGTPPDSSDPVGGGSTGGPADGGTAGGGTGGPADGGTTGGTGGTAGGGSTGGTPSDENPPDGCVSRPEVTNCSDLLGSDASKIRVIKQGTDITVSGNQPVALKITGNQSKVTLNIFGAEGKTLPGLCVFATGNQSNVTINLGVALGGFYYKGRGNQSRTVLQVSQIGSLLKSFAADLSGHLASLTVWGQGKYICPATIQSGNGSSVSCTPN